MHKYQPRLHIVKSNEISSVVTAITQINTQLRNHHIVLFKEAVFIAVTAYQNEMVTLFLNIFDEIVLFLKARKIDNTIENRQ